MTTVVICDPIHKDAIAMLEQAGMSVIDQSSDNTGLEQVLGKADAIIVRSATKVTADFLDKCPSLRIIGRSGVGLDNIDLETAKERDIKVINSPEGPSRSVAELALGMMIAASRKFGVLISETKAGNWPKKEKGQELFGKTLGIIGTGAIGGTLAHYALALGMNVLGYDIIEYDELKELAGFSYVDLATLYAQSDYISLHVPLLPATKHMIDEDALEQMKDGVIIINCARGGTIDEDALLAALVKNKVGGVGLDVYEEEPVDATRELIQHPLVITTAHNGAQTAEASKNNSTVVANKLIKFFDQ